MDETAHPRPAWTLLTNHGRLLLLLARHPDIRLRELAELAGITERATQSIVSDLEAAGYITKQREGRRNSYRIDPHRPFRHPAERGHEVGELFHLFGGDDLAVEGLAENGAGQDGAAQDGAAQDGSAALRDGVPE
ncbi:MAG: helix-turn-helix transcriptional regulator [Actinomycetes bacterium]